MMAQRLRAPGPSLLLLSSFLVRAAALEEVAVDVDSSGEVHPEMFRRTAIATSVQTGSLLDMTSGPPCPINSRVPLGGECKCGSETCKKEQYCFPSADDGKDSCKDEPEKDPSQIIWTTMTRNGPTDGRDDGALTGRTLKFKKKFKNSILRILYTDNLRIYGSSCGSASARFELKIDGSSCPSGKMSKDLYVYTYMNPHRYHTWGGHCKGIKEGEHTLTAIVGSNGYSCRDAYAGWAFQQPLATVYLEVQEIPEDYPFFHVKTGRNSDSRDSGVVTGRSIRFKKLTKDSLLRLFYSDDGRAYGGSSRSCSCSWHLRIDGQPCSSGRIQGDVYVYPHENPHAPLSVAGYCKDVSAGQHTVDVEVKVTQGWSACDCHTGWTTASGGGQYILEAEEIPASYKMVNYIQKYQADGRDEGILTHYKLDFKKQHDDTRLRLLFQETNRAAYSTWSCAGRWEILIDGTSCATGSIHGDIYVTRHSTTSPYNRDINPYRTRIFAGACDDYEAGDHKLTVKLTPQKSGSNVCNLQTGWSSASNGRASGLLEVIEIFRQCSEFEDKKKCKQPRCFWDEKKCIDLVHCPGSDKVAVGADCLCGDAKIAKGKYCFEDNKTSSDAPKPEATESKSAANVMTYLPGLALALPVAAGVGPLLL
mmetsp:Transcript_13102/g.29939  ORF Transcript_13102/g.29939 Transcript_13102/m.29939 type:complete len:648 (+) Transcript_13102:63-2006(+)